MLKNCCKVNVVLEFFFKLELKFVIIILYFNFINILILFCFDLLFYFKNDFILVLLVVINLKINYEIY